MGLTDLVTGKSKYKAEKQKKAEEKLNKEHRKPDVIEIDMDQVTKQIGKLHHQKVCLEAQINQETNRFHNLLMEFSESREAFKVTDEVTSV